MLGAYALLEGAYYLVSCSQIFGIFLKRVSHKSFFGYILNMCVTQPYLLFDAS